MSICVIWRGNVGSAPQIAGAPPKSAIPANANAPKLGDKAAWAPRAATGKDALLASVIKGKGAMPPKAGAADLKNDDIKAAIDYMLASVK